MFRSVACFLNCFFALLMRVATVPGGFFRMSDISSYDFSSKNFSTKTSLYFIGRLFIVLSMFFLVIFVSTSLMMSRSEIILFKLISFDSPGVT